MSFTRYKLYPLRNPPQPHVPQPLTPVLGAGDSRLKHIANLLDDVLTLFNGQHIEELRAHQTHPPRQTALRGRREFGRPILGLHLLDLEADILQRAGHPVGRREEPRDDLSGPLDRNALLHECVDQGRENLAYVPVGAHLENERAAWFQAAVDAAQSGHARRLIPQDPVESRVGNAAVGRLVPFAVYSWRYDLHLVPLAIHDGRVLLQVAAVQDAECRLGPGIVLVGRLDHRRGAVDAQDILDCGDEGLGELAVPAADVQDSVGWLRVEVAEDSLGQFGDEGGRSGVCLRFSILVYGWFV